MYMVLYSTKEHRPIERSVLVETLKYHLVPSPQGSRNLRMFWQSLSEAKLLTIGVLIFLPRKFTA